MTAGQLQLYLHPHCSFIILNHNASTLPPTVMFSMCVKAIVKSTPANVIMEVEVSVIDFKNNTVNQMSNI